MVRDFVGGQVIGAQPRRSDTRTNRGNLKDMAAPLFAKVRNSRFADMDIRFRGDGEWLARKHGATHGRKWRNVDLVTAPRQVKSVLSSSPPADKATARSCRS